MCFIQDVITYVKELIGYCDNTQEDINEINIGPGQSINVDEYGYTGVITCIDYSMFKVQLNSYVMWFDNINDCYNWLQRSSRYMMEFDYYIS